MAFSTGSVPNSKYWSLCFTTLCVCTGRLSRRPTTGSKPHRCSKHRFHTGVQGDKNLNGGGGVWRLSHKEHTQHCGFSFVLGWISCYIKAALFLCAFSSPLDDLVKVMLSPPYLLHSYLMCLCHPPPAGRTLSLLYCITCAIKYQKKRPSF